MKEGDRLRELKGNLTDPLSLLILIDLMSHMGISFDEEDTQRLFEDVYIRFPEEAPQFQLQILELIFRSCYREPQKQYHLVRNILEISSHGSIDVTVKDRSLLYAHILFSNPHLVQVIEKHARMSIFLIFVSYGFDFFVFRFLDCAFSYQATSIDNASR